jgi:hypothetical protein
MTILSRTPSNTDLLQSTKFRVIFEKFPSMTYFCTSANLPGVSLTEIIYPTSLLDVYVPGEKILYDTLNITFLVDEDLRAWTEIHDWIRGLTFPTEFEEFVNLARSTNQSIPPLLQRGTNGVGMSDAVLTLHTNKNNPNIRFKFIDLFPTSVSTIVFNTGDSAENIMTADATFRFAYYNYERLK